MNRYLILGGLIVIIIVGVIMLVHVFASNGTTNVNKGYIPEEGYVPNEATAVKVAEAVWLPIYGENIYKKQPFIAKYDEKENCWIVNGTLPPDTFGGVPEIKISKSTGEILFVYHGK